VAHQILDGLDYSKIPRYADEMDPLDVAGEGAERKPRLRGGRCTVSEYICTIYKIFNFWPRKYTMKPEEKRRCSLAKAALAK
jgi:hypothetical protein